MLKIWKRQGAKKKEKKLTLMGTSLSSVILTSCEKLRIGKAEREYERNTIAK